MSKYSEIMEHVYVTPEMKERILSGINRHFRDRNWRSRVRIYSFAAAAAVVLIAAVGLRQYLGRSDNSLPGAYQSEGVADAFAVIDYGSAKELSAAVGFDVPLLSSLPFDVQQISYTAFGNELAQVRYTGADDSEVITYRKSPGGEDNSGDYNNFSESDAIEVNDMQIQVKGNDGLVYLACWNDGEYAYSISVDAGCSKDVIIALVSE